MISKDNFLKLECKLMEMYMVLLTQNPNKSEQNVNVVHDMSLL